MTLHIKKNLFSFTTYPGQLEHERPNASMQKENTIGEAVANEVLNGINRVMSRLDSLQDEIESLRDETKRL